VIERAKVSQLCEGRGLKAQMLIRRTELSATTKLSAEHELKISEAKSPLFCNTAVGGWCSIFRHKSKNQLNGI
jgi:hypothetical protein